MLRHQFFQHFVFDILTFFEVGSFYLSEFGGIFSNHAERMAELEIWRSYGHIPGDTEARKVRACRFCMMYDLRSSSGQKVRVRHRCVGCDVPLCSKHRDCFYQYHKILFSKKENCN